MSKIYVASSWLNGYQPAVVTLLREGGHEVYDFRHPLPNENGFDWRDVDPTWRSWSTEEYRDYLDHPLSCHGFANDWNAMEWADTGVLLMPCGRSAHLEAGYFVGARKPLYILLFGQREPELMYKMSTGGVFSSLNGLLEKLDGAKP